MGCGAVINLGVQPSPHQQSICAAHLFLMDTASTRKVADAVRAQTVFPVVHIQSPIVEPDIIKVATVVYAVRTIRGLVHMVQPVVILI